MFGFGTRVTDRFDEFEDLVGCGRGQNLGCGVGSKEGRGDEVDALVGTLCREHDRNEALEGVFKMQFALCNWHVGFKPSENVFIAFCCSHNKSCLGIGGVGLRVVAHRLSAVLSRVSADVGA